MPLPDDLTDKWNEAFANPGTTIKVGDTVVCDFCDADFTSSAESGGFIFGSKGVCPRCTPKMMRAIVKYGEGYLIRAMCPEGESFADFIRAYRGPDAGITITEGKIPT